MQDVIQSSLLNTCKLADNKTKIVINFYCDFTVGKLDNYAFNKLRVLWKSLLEKRLAIV